MIMKDIKAYEVPSASHEVNVLNKVVRNVAGAYKPGQLG
jgi:hypothetical protein